jgi:acyl-CoA synthetase (AMP-forming)/AMP-acid ligase II
LLAGGTVICTKDFIPSDFYSLLKKFRPTYYIAVPALHQGILRELNKFAPDELEDSSLRLILSSSASMPDRVRHGLEKLLHVPVIEILASSESGTISINFPPKHGSVGIPVIEHLTIRSETNKILRPYEEGEIVVKGEAVFSGYEDAPDENDAAFIDGWFRTGDMGYLDDEGYLFLTGRKKEIINKGGRKIAPEEIDTVLREHPQVKDAMTFGIADPVLGEDVAAIVVPADETITEADLRMYLLDRLIQFKVPRKIWFVDRIPRTPTGKPQRQEGTRRFSPGL